MREAILSTRELIKWYCAALDRSGSAEAFWVPR